LSPNPAHDPTRLNEQLDPIAASLLPHRVPPGWATLHASCRIVPMLNLASNNPTHLAQLILRLNFPLTHRARTEAKKKFFSQKIQTDLK
jgi:hypothetical protein